MKKDLYNSTDAEFQHVIKLLKEMPNEKAPENFEYNLSVRIKNRNFEPSRPEKSAFNLWKIFVPVTGAIVASVLVVFISFDDSDSAENPFQIQPQLRNELSASILGSSGINNDLSPDTKISETDVVFKERIEKEAITDEVVSKNITFNLENKIAEKPSSEGFPFNEYNSTNLDQVLLEKRSSTKISGKAALTGSNNSAFNGFFIREEVDKEYVEAMKARMDSLKKELRIKRKTTKIAQ
jgi:hypothetical protein